MIKNLIFNEDIIAIKKKMLTQNLTPLELELLRHEGWNEHRVQSAAKIFFDRMNTEFEARKIGKVFFFQIDNGANNLSAGAKIRKWQEGTVAKMPDTGIIIFCAKKNHSKTLFCEFKKVGTEREICGNSDSKSGLKIKRHYECQLALHEGLRKMNCIVYLTNNLVYCEKVIGEEIRAFCE